CGLICASGSLFDYSLVADGRLLADHVEDYYVDFALEGGMLIYTRDGGSEQLALSELFAGKIQPVAFEGYEAPVVEESREPEAEALFFNESFEESSVEDTPLDPNDPQSPMRSSQEAVLDVNASLAAMSARAENVGAVCKPCAVDPVPVEPHDGALRRNVSNGVMNIVRRSRQMLNIRWTPQKNVSSWGYAQTYEKGVTYTGLPYCQLCSYVPWNTGLDEFLNAVNDPNSKMYTARTTYGRTGPFYGIDCSAFATWAWGNTSRGTTWSMKADSNNLYIGTDYLKLQLGDALLSDSHVMLVTDITYNSDGSIKTVEISHSSNTYSTVGCCNSMHFSGTDGLLKIKQSYLDKGYGIYRSANRDQVGYTHSCAVPLEGDVCSKCGVGIPAEPVVPETPEVPENDAFFKSGIDVSRWQGQIDWKKVSTQIDFAILRVGYTGTANPVPVEDNTFEENVAGCEANGIPYGVYYYAGATSPEQAVKEAEAVLEYLGTRTTSKALRLPVFYDVEETENV
ncbi:MAG: hypothetical protein IIY70_06345, partial [Oscillospiraceae bacterium]|nr:hypothetical protein [Oscillospiraceae bacterium]